MKKQQAGFTLIELIMVIVILGILSAFALPRFADLGGEARAAAIQGAAGSIKSAAAIAHSQFLAEGDNTASEVSMEGLQIEMINGYPEAQSGATTATTFGILQAAGISTGTAGDFDQSGSPGATDSSSVIVEAKGATGTCQVSYTAAGTGATPTIAVDVSGC